MIYLFQIEDMEQNNDDFHEYQATVFLDNEEDTLNLLKYVNSQMREYTKLMSLNDESDGLENYNYRAEVYLLDYGEIVKFMTFLRDVEGEVIDQEEFSWDDTDDKLTENAVEEEHDTLSEKEGSNVVDGKPRCQGITMGGEACNRIARTYCSHHKSQENNKPVTQEGLEKFSHWSTKRQGPVIKDLAELYKDEDNRTSGGFLNTDSLRGLAGELGLDLVNLRQWVYNNLNLIKDGLEKEEDGVVSGNANNSDFSSDFGGNDKFAKQRTRDEVPDTPKHERIRELREDERLSWPSIGKVVTEEYLDFHGAADVHGIYMEFYDEEQEEENEEYPFEDFPDA